MEAKLARPASKTASFTVRIGPDIKRLLAVASVAERRSLANMLEVMVLDYCNRRGILDRVDFATTTDAQPSRRAD